MARLQFATLTMDGAIYISSFDAPAPTEFVSGPFARVLPGTVAMRGGLNEVDLIETDGRRTFLMDADCRSSDSRALAPVSSAYVPASPNNRFYDSGVISGSRLY